MSDDDLPALPARVRGRPFQPGRSGNPAGRRPGSRNKATLAAAALLAGEAEGLTRRAVELALAGDPVALKLSLDRVLPPCRERPVAFRLPAIRDDAPEAAESPLAHEVTVAMRAVTSALARGVVTPGEAATIAGAYQTFVRAVATAKKEVPRPSLLRIIGALRARAADVEDDDDADDGEAEDDDDRDW